MTKLRRQVRRVRQEAEVAADEMQPQLRKLVDAVKSYKVRVQLEKGFGAVDVAVFFFLFWCLVGWCRA